MGNKKNVQAIQDRVEAWVQPMAEHEVQAVDVDTQTRLSGAHARALVVVAALAMLGVGVFSGIKLMGGHEDDPQQWSALALPSGGQDSRPEQAQDHASRSPSQVEQNAAESKDSARESSGPPGPVVVSVQGMVARPGLLRLDAGTRLGEAIDAAGGALPGSNIMGVNLAAKVTDGMQVVVDDHGSVVLEAGPASAQGASGQAISGQEAASQATGGQAAAAPGRASDGMGTTAGAGQHGGLIDLNTADATQLQTLPGVGPSTANAIVSWRDSNGRFTSVEQLLEVKGIGPAKFEALRESVGVG